MLGFLLKSELCQKCSKFRMQFSLRVSNNVLHVFFSEVCIILEILRMQKTLHLLSRQHVTAKTVISLQTQQISDLSQGETLTYVDFRLKPLKF